MKSISKNNLWVKVLFFLGLVFILTHGTVYAYPVLQLYIDGSEYDPLTDTWMTTSPVFDFWVIGDVGHVGTIYDVKMTVSFFGSGGTISITPKTTSKIPDFSVPGFNPHNTITVDGKTYPFSGTGGHPSLPPHGIFNDPALNHWTDYYLGDFNLKDSPVGDFMTSFPSNFDSIGQVNVYEIAVSGWERVHFDAHDHIVMTNGKGKKRYKNVFAPFSHDATGTPVPEPGTLTLLGIGFAGMAAASGFFKWLRHPDKNK